MWGQVGTVVITSKITNFRQKIHYYLGIIWCQDSGTGRRL